MRKSTRVIVLLSIVMIIVVLMNNQLLTSCVFGKGKYRKVHLQPGNISVPIERKMVWKARSEFADSIIKNWADKKLPINLDGKGNYPRILLAKLQAKRDVPEVNQTIRKMTVWGVSGTSWVLNPKGDYDFTITVMTTILYQFGDLPDLLYPETKDYLLKVLLTEEGSKPRYTAPRTLGFVSETENHVLMTEGSKYLKNRWLMNHGNKDPKFDNVGNGLEDQLISFLNEMRTNGLYEFNSLPYIGYTITALLNLEAFGSEKLRNEARNVLDYMNWTYALGSYQLKHYPPMRRRYEKAGITEITTNYQSIFMKTWLSFSDLTDFDRNIGGGEVHALMGACMPYRPADKVVELIFNKGNGYFVKLGHGPQSCPEIYTAGKHFLLSAGGANQGKMSIIVARPTTLFLTDHADHLSETIHLAGPGTDFMKWNNTGVYRNFAVAAGPVSVPATFKPVIQKGNWAAYSLNDSVAVAVYSTDKLGLMNVSEGIQPEKLMRNILQANPDTGHLNQSFQIPGGQKIEYDVLAPKDKWVIISFNGQPLERDFEKWPLLGGDFE